MAVAGKCCDYAQRKRLQKSWEKIRCRSASRKQVSYHAAAHFCTVLKVISMMATIVGVSTCVVMAVYMYPRSSFVLPSVHIKLQSFCTLCFQCLDDGHVGARSIVYLIFFSFLTHAKPELLHVFIVLQVP